MLPKGRVAVCLLAFPGCDVVRVLQQEWIPAMNVRPSAIPGAILSLLVVLIAAEARGQTTNVTGTWIIVKKLDAEGVYWPSKVQLTSSGRFTDSLGFPNPSGQDGGTWAITPPDMISFWYTRSAVFLDGNLNADNTYMYGVIDNGIIGDYWAFRFDFDLQTDVAPDSMVYSNKVRVYDALTTRMAISSCTGDSCAFRINNGAWISDTGTIHSGDTVQVRQISSSLGGTKTDLTLTLAGLPTTFSVTTRSPTHTLRTGTVRSAGRNATVFKALGNRLAAAQQFAGTSTVANVYSLTGRKLERVVSNGNSRLLDLGREEGASRGLTVVQVQEQRGIAPRQ
jgi:hypothetical protein